MTATAQTTWHVYRGSVLIPVHVERMLCVGCQTIVLYVPVLITMAEILIMPAILVRYSTLLTHSSLHHSYNSLLTNVHNTEMLSYIPDSFYQS